MHRDLKPANVFVTEDGQPKILDFGVARATDADIEVTTLQTNVGQLVGTIPYMSPEQVEGNPGRVDLKADIYALGVMGYELLAGHLPHQLRHLAVPEALRVIREDEPEPLSSVDALFRGDLDTIMATAMEKDKSRRYATADALADDIERFLQDEPIVARPPSKTYLLQKLVMRNRAMVAGMVAVFLTLLGGIATTSWQAYHATIARTRAEEEAIISREISAYLHDMLSSIDPASAQGEDISVRQVLDEASQTVASSFADRPRVRASLHRTIGLTYQALGEYGLAEPHLRSSLDLHQELFGREHPATAESINSVANLAYFSGNYPEAEALYRDALAIRRRLYPGENTDVATTLNDLSVLLAAKAEYAEAERFVREALSIRRHILGDVQPDTATALNNLAAIVERQGRWEEAEKYYHESLAIHRKLEGDRHPSIAILLNNLALLQQKQGNPTAAEALLREALDIRQAVYGANHTDVAASINNLAALMYKRKDYVEATSLARQGLDIRRRILSPTHPHIARSLRLLGQIALETGDYAEGETILRECLEIRQASLVGGHHLIAEAASVLGECIAHQQRYVEAEPLLVDAYATILNARGETHKRAIEALNRIVALYDSWNKQDKARPWRQRLALVGQ